MLDGSVGAVVPTPSFHLSSDNLFQQSGGTYHHPFSGGPSSSSSLGQQSSSTQQQQQRFSPSQLGLGHSAASQTFAAALFSSSSPLLNDDIKLAAAAAAAVAAQSRGKKTHRTEPVPQSGFKGVSWNSRMKAWLAFYVTENGERKSKTFSTRKLGMEEARLQAIAFCKLKQDQRREARRRHRGGLVGGGTGGGLSDPTSVPQTGMDKLNSPDESMGVPSPPGLLPDGHTSTMRCGYPTLPGMSPSPQASTPPSQSASSSEVAYVPIVPIAMEMIEKSGLLQPLELNVLPPCQYCNKQPYPFLMIVSEGQEQTYGGSSIMSLTSHSTATASGVPISTTPAVPPAPSSGGDASSGTLDTGEPPTSSVQPCCGASEGRTSSSNLTDTTSSAAEAIPLQLASVYGFSGV